MDYTRKFRLDSRDCNEEVLILKKEETMKQLLTLSLLIILNLNANTFLGHTIKNKVGLSACILGNSEGIAELAKQECSILTYKSVRSKPATRHPEPNLGYITETEQLTRSSLATGLSVTTDYNLMQPISIANSYGVESAGVSEVLNDIKAARQALEKGQMLIVSIYPQAYPGISREQDAHYLAQLVKQAGAQAIEINIACPNTHEKPLYQDLEELRSICSAAVQGADQFPVLIKIGFISDKEILRNVVKTAVNAGIRGITSMNSIAIEILNTTHEKNFFPDRPVAGVSGDIIRDLALEQINTLVTIRAEEDLDFDIAGVGGISQPEHFDTFLNAGANVALSATGLIHNHNLVKEYVESKQALTTEEKNQLIEKLYTNELIKFGSFTLKNGTVSPIYMDLRATISHPELFSLFTQSIAKISKTLKYDVICGIPYGALPFAASTAYELKHRMVMKRKETKDHGTRKIIEGAYKSGDKALIIEDVITSGGSCLETVESLETHGLQVKDIVVFMSYPKGKNNLQKKGYHVHELLTFEDIVNYFCSHNRLDTSRTNELQQYATTVIV